MKQKLSELTSDFDNDNTKTDESRSTTTKEVTVMMYEEGEIDTPTGIYLYIHERLGLTVKQMKGLILCVICGLLNVGWAAFSTIAMKPGPGKLTPYTGMLFIAMGVCCTIPLLTTLLLYYPFYGKKGDPHTWVTDFSMRDHLMAGIAGALSLLSLLLSFIGGDVVGYGISFAIIQINPVVSSLLGIFLWREFVGTSLRIKILLAIMIFIYLTSIGIIAASFI